MRYMEFFAGLLGKADALGVPRNNDVDIMKFVNLALWVAGIIAVIVVIIAGINYSLSSGDQLRRLAQRMLFYIQSLAWLLLLVRLL